MPQQQYALLSRSKLLRLPSVDDATNDNNKSNVVNDDDVTTVVLRDQLAAIYQSYAEMYPNPRLMEEIQEREKLWAAALAADSARKTALERDQGQPSEASSTKQRGFFSRLLFGSNSKPSTQNIHVPKSNLKVEDVLEFIEEEGDQETLCGTQFSLDPTCIPQEAYARARFHAACSFRRQLPNIVRNATNFSMASPSTIVITGLGTIVEFQPSTDGDQSNDYVAKVRHTADREDLHDFMVEASVTFELSNARGAMVGENLLAVSWGLIDGVVVLYRRMEFSTLPDAGWEPIAASSPSPAVVCNMTGADDFLHEETETNLLRVTDMLPLVVDGPAGGPPAAACLAVGRLGGYIELVPLPISLWWAPVLTPKNHKRPSASRKRKRKRRSNDPLEHYALGKLVDLTTTMPAVVALTTCDYHIDLICLQAFRTSVSVDTDWDKVAFPNSPPAEFVLSACGGRDGRETMTFWAVNTIFAQDDAGKGQGIGFSIHAILLEAIDIGPVGPDITIFANDATMKNWRKPRQVELKVQGLTIGSSNMNMIDEDERSKDTHRVSTISMSTPVVSMRFDTSGSDSSSLLMAVLDWSGGVCILDCSRVARLASQTLTQEEYEAVHNQPEDADPIPLVTMLCNRSKVKAILPTKTNLDICWLPRTEPHDGPSANARLVVFSSHPTVALQVLEAKNLDPHHPTLIRTTCVEIPSNLWVAFTGDTSQIGTLSFVSRKRQNKSSQCAFFMCSMQRVEPKSVVESLFRAGKFMEAIEATTGFSLNEDILNVIDTCHKRLWEQTRQVRHLEAITDDSYVVQQALFLLENVETEVQVDIDTLRSACLLGLTRAENARLALALKLGGSDGTTTIASKLRNATIKIGTYQLLCRHLRANGSSQGFQRDFLNVSLVKLAKAFARGADIPALTAVVFRHKKEIGYELFDILALIPVTVGPAMYLHLLPVVSENGEVQVLMNDGVNSRMPFSQLPQLMFKNAGLAIVLDADDEKLVLQENGMECDDQMHASRVASFYSARARMTYRFLGDLQAFVDFSELGLKAFGVESLQLDNRVSFDKIPVTANDLYQDCRCATLLYHASLAVGDPKQRRLPGRDSVQIDDLRKLSVDEVTALVLDGTSRYGVVSAIDNYLRPLVLTLSGYDSAHSNDEKIEDSIASYCSGLIASHRSHASSVNDSDLWGLRNKLALGCAIAQASSSGIRKQDRIIKDRRKLFTLIQSSTIQVIRILGEANSETGVPNSETGVPNGVVETMWEMYESLPSQVTPIEAQDDSFVSMHKKIDVLFGVLVGVDIVSRWPDCTGLKLLADMLDTNDCNGAKLENNDVGLQLVSELLNCFVGEIGKIKTNDMQRKLELVQDIISDVNELNNKAFSGVLPISTVTDKIVVKPLLFARQFIIVAEVISQFPQKWLSRSQLISSVQSFVNDAIAPSEREQYPGAGHQFAHAVIACQDILGPLLPELRSDFLSIRRELDALHFIETILLRDETSNHEFGLSALKKKLPMDVVESILMRNPRCIIHGCLEWADSSYASQINARIREHANGSPSDDLNSHPPLPLLPGGAVFQLATILGLDDPASVVVVKSRVVHYGLASGIHGASAAICRTLLDHDKTLGYSGPADILRLRAVAETVGHDSYVDKETKFELCGLAVKLFRGGSKMPLSLRCDFDTILQAFRSLEQRNTTTMHGKKRGDFVTDRIYRDIKVQYSTDIHELFSTLAMNASSCLVDETLLNALCRFVIFWCIADCTNTLVYDSAQALYVKEQLALGTSLLMHLYSTPMALSNLEEFRRILSTQMSAHRGQPDRSKQFEIVAYDPSVVRKLRGRGYSENGARRAAIMANNDFDSALIWAVTHSLDSKFDEPIVILKNRKIIPAVDRAGALLVEETLAYAQKVVEGSISIQALRPATSDTQASIGTSQKDAKELQATSNESLSEESHSRKGAISNVRKLGDVALKTSETSLGARKLLTPSEFKPNGLPTKVSSGASQPNVGRYQKDVVEPKQNRLSHSGPELDLERHASTNNEPNPATPQKSASLESSPDRAVLRQQGQAVRQLAQNTSASILSTDERRRLMEQGRRLLQKARESRTYSPSHPTNLFSASPASLGTSPTTQSAVPHSASDGTPSTSSAPIPAPANFNQSSSRPGAASLDRDYHDSKSGEDEDGWDWDI